MDHLLQDFTPSSSTLRSLPWSSHTFLWAPPSPPTLSPCAAFMSLCYCLSPSGWQAFVVRVQALFLSTTNKTPLDLSSDSLISQKTSNHPPLLCPLRLATMLFSTRSGPDRVLTMEYAITNLISTPAWWDRDYSVPIVQMRTLRLREKRKQTQGTQLIRSIVKVYSLVVSLQRLPWSRCPSPYLPSLFFLLLPQSWPPPRASYPRCLQPQPVAFAHFLFSLECPSASLIDPPFVLHESEHLP